jgi:hypothetical protein
MYYLEIVDGASGRQRIELNRPRLLLGREPSCDICLPHPGVSRRHAQLQVTDQGRWLLQDLSSLNHVFVDNKPVKQVVLELGKPFSIADFTLVLEEELPAEEPQVGTAIPQGLAGTDSLPDPAWLERLQLFQRSLFRLDGPRDVLDRLAREFQRCLRPRLLAVGVAKSEGYAWDLVVGNEGCGVQPQELEEADRRIGMNELDSVQIWGAGSGNVRQPDILRDLPEAGDPLALLIPMKGRTGVVGHVFVQGPEDLAVPKSIVQYLSMLGVLAGLMWENLELAGLRREQTALHKELEQARQIQIELFPETFQLDPRLDAFAVNLPSAQVSGDYYDLVRTGPNTVAFVIADAMGHGMPAALLMAAVRAALRMGLTLGLPWPAIFHGLDGVTIQARGEVFVTGLVGLIDLAKQELQMVCAGHPLPSILVDGKAVAVPQTCLTRPWGLDIPATWEAASIPLKGKSWSILCYTDGVTDAAARTQPAFGARRIATYHAENYQLSAEDLCQRLLSEVAVQPGQQSLQDDQTVLALRSVGALAL